LIHALETQLIAKHVELLLGATSYTVLMDRMIQSQWLSTEFNDALNSLVRLYLCLSRVKSIEALRLAFLADIKRRGQSAVMNEERDQHLIHDLLDLKLRAEKIIHAMFPTGMSDAALLEKFTQTLQDAFESFMNLRHNKPAELLSRYMDSLLRAGGLKKLTIPPGILIGSGGDVSSSVEPMLKHLLMLFRYLSSKDLFEAFYKKDLARRLLLDKSASVDLEKNVLASMKVECGVGFVSKLEGMFKDLDLSRDVLRAFKDSKMGQSVTAFELNVHVLTQGFWPAYTPVNLRLPTEMEEALEAFKTFYTSKHQNRNLQWQHTLGDCLIRSRFPSGTKDLSVSLFQAVVLLCFNNDQDPDDNVVRSFAEIKQATGLDDVDLMCTLQSLAGGKVRVLTKLSKGKINISDQFKFNHTFTHPLHRIKINQVQAKATPAEIEKTQEQVVHDRQFQIDAAIVRVMKARKSLKHSQLMQEVITLCSSSRMRNVDGSSSGGFPLSSADMKKRVESLIERDFIQRDTVDSSLYHYVA
jgi:cullin-4